MKRTVQLFVLVAVFISLGFLTNASAQQAGSGKFAFVDVGKLFDGYSKTKDYDKTLEEKYNAYEMERNKKLEKIKNAEGQLSVLKKEEQEKQQAQLEKDKAGLMEFDRIQQTDLRKQRDEKIKEILLEIEKIVKDFAQKENYSMIFNDKVLIYGQDSLNITEQVLKKLNGGN